MARVLIADDDPNVREVLLAFLEEDGHDVVEAPNGHDAVKLFRRDPADLVVCDLFMPGKDGLETIRELRRYSPGVPILAISGGGFGGTFDMLPSARHFGASETLYKPFSTSELREVLESLLYGNQKRTA